MLREGRQAEVETSFVEANDHIGPLARFLRRDSAVEESLRLQKFMFSFVEICDKIYRK